MDGIEGVVLAAGLSRRAGTHKLLLDIGGKTLIERCIEGMYDQCAKITVVGGYRIEHIAMVLQKYAKVKLVYNPDYQEGMFSSVKVGFRNLREKKFFFTPGDYPFIGQSVYENMLGVEGDIIIPVYNGQKGHPVLMKRETANEVIEGGNWTNLHDFIQMRGFTLVAVEEPGVLMDIDTMEDYQRMKVLAHESI